MKATKPAKKKTDTLTDWDMAEYIKTKKDVVAHLEAALSENDVPFLLSVVGDIARSEGMTKIARSLGMSREGLYRSLSPTGKPSFETMIKLLNLLGLRLSVEYKHPKRKSA
ncbi:MAG: putative addiction module antidote protein [Treponema sp.]|nr:putative addiction module antidote protein [Treponema sp.]